MSEGAKTKTSSKKPLIYQKMAAVLASVKAIGKDKRNKIQGFNFRGIDDVYNHLNPLLAENGIFCTSEILSHWFEERKTKNGTNMLTRIYHMRYTFYCEDGSSVATETMGEAQDSGDKASNKAMAAAHKYALFQVFLIPTENMDDPDASSPEPTEHVTIYKATPEQKKELAKRLKIQGISDPNVMRRISNAWFDKPINEMYEAIKKEKPDANQ